MNMNLMFFIPEDNTRGLSRTHGPLMVIASKIDFVNKKIAHLCLNYEEIDGVRHDIKKHEWFKFDEVTIYENPELLKEVEKC